MGPKYTWDPIKLFAGYEYIRQADPSNPLGVGALDQGGYIMSGVEDHNLDSPNSINTNPITGANLIGTANTVYGIVTDNSAIMVAAKYTWDPFKLFAGYEYIRQTT